MDNPGKANISKESSLLLKYPINLFSTNLSNDNLLMPVGLQETNAITDNSEVSTKSSDSTNTGESGISSAICQLEQPLLFGGVSKPNQTNLYTSNASQVTALAQSTIASVSKPLEHPVQGNPMLYSQTKSSSYEPDFSSLSNISSQITTPLITEYKNNSEPHHASAFLEPNNYAGTPLLQPNEFQIGSGIYDTQSSHEYRDNVDKSGQCYPGKSFDPVQPYWFFSDIIESKEIWYGFSKKDSQKLEEAYQLGSDSIVPTDGSRCDVYINLRKKKFVYFDSKELHVRRCTWFHQQGSSMRFKPYDENTSHCLEEFYHKWITSGAQDMRFVVPGIIGSFLFEKPLIMLHYGVDANAWTAPNEPKGSPKIVKRGLPEGGFQIMPDESPQIDHLLFIVQGIGSFCDLRFRTVAECVDGFRDIANKLIDSHFRKEVEQGCVGRVEILPVAWHAKLRTSDIGLDRTMKMITLPSIPKLRHFTNDTLIDILLYSSSSYCQSIVDTVAQELNNLYEVFVSRNPEFCGKIFVAGHSLGSLILFDILSSQNVIDCKDESTKLECAESFENNERELEGFIDIEHLLRTLDLEEYLDVFKNEKIDLSTLPFLSDEDLKNICLPIGPRRKLMNAGFFKKKTAEPEEMESSISETITNEVSDTENKTHDCHNRMIFPFQKPNTEDSSVIYPRLHFYPAAFFAMGSPISMFLAIRGFDSISEKFSFPTCPAFFHIFHPYDPVAFRIEPMIDHSFMKKPALIPHHKGRKRMHLEIKENVTKFANELRQKVMDTLHKTWHSFNELTGLQPFPPAILEQEVSSMVSQEIPEVTSYDENTAQDTPIGNLNGGRRIDYVLQEKPLEALNDYVWALTSHATYWDSEDTVLMILREIYAIQGINVSPHIESFILDAPESLPSAQNYNSLPRERLEKTYPSNLPRKDSLSSSTSSNMNISLPSNIAPLPSSNVAPSFENANYSLPPSSNVAPSFDNANYSLLSSSNVAPSFESANYSLLPSSNVAPLFENANYSLPSSSNVAPSFESSNYSLPTSAASNVAPTYESANYSLPSSEPEPPMLPHQPLGPPPLTGFVKRSAFSK